MTNQTIVIFRADADAFGWIDRKLMPSGSLTKTLAEHSNYSGKIPKPGYRLDEFSSPDGSGRDTHWSPGDWIVTEVDHYPSPSEGKPAIAVCYCEYSPIERDWKPLGNGRPVPELLAEMAAISETAK